jgi:hypothetical protein
MALKGRHWLALWLLGVLAALSAVVWRQTEGLQAARALAVAREQRAAFEGRQRDLERRIRAARSRAVLVPRALKLGLRQPADSEIILLPAPGATPPPPPR